MFLGYIHSYRALAILFIVAGHSIDAFLWNNTSLELMLRILISNGSVLFVFIAGYLFQHLSANYRVYKYLKTKVYNVIIPYLIVSIPAIFIFVTVMHRETVWSGFYDQSILLQVISFYLTGKHLAPLWFIPFISLIYILSPLLIWADRKRYCYIALPGFILLSCIYSRGSMPLENLQHFFSIFFLGMFLSRYKRELNALLSNLKVLTSLLILIAALVFFEFYKYFPEISFINYLQKIIMSVFFLGFFIRLGEKANSSYTSTLANVSFGIFFIHSYLITGLKILYTSFFDELPIGNLMNYLLMVIGVTIISTLFILAIKKTTRSYSKFIVGS